MGSKVRSRVASLIAGALLVALSAAPAAAAGKPNPSIGFYVCWTGATVYMQITWSRVVVDAYSFGWSSEGGGLGVPADLSRPSPAGTVSTSSADYELTVDPSATLVGGSLSFRGTVVFEGNQPRPEAGWAAIGACNL